MLDAHADRVRGLVGDALTAVKHAFRAMDGKRPDHRVRLIAAKRVIEMATAGRTAESSTYEHQSITLEQLEELYRGETA